MLLGIVCILGFSGCLAPLSSNFTGRSLGKGNWGGDIGLLIVDQPISHTAKLTFGLTPNLDIGAQSDAVSVGLFGKYSILNPFDEGIALAVVLSGGTTHNGIYAYTGPILSFKHSFFEPYFVGRYNYVHYQGTESFGSSIVDAGHYSYFQFTFGSVFWFSQRIGINLEISTFSESTWHSELGGYVGMAGLKFRF